MADKKNSSLPALISRYNAVPAFKAGTVILLIYGLLLAVLLLLHVPTLDEAQAWLIARDATYKDILLYLPHYESHPPFWHLLLSIPAKLGVSYELGLKSIQFISSVLMISVLSSGRRSATLSRHLYRSLISFSISTDCWQGRMLSWWQGYSSVHTISENVKRHRAS